MESHAMFSGNAIKHDVFTLENQKDTTKLQLLIPEQVLAAILPPY